MSASDPRAETAGSREKTDVNQPNQPTTERRQSMSQHSKWNTEDRTFPPVTPQTVLSPQEARAYNTLVAGRRVSEVEWMIHQMALRVSGDYGVPRHPHLPKPGDDVEAWLKSHRDRWTRAP